MKRFVIKRVATGKDGTFGAFLEAVGLDLIPFALTLERPWLDNAVGISCIPSGNYVCRRVNSPRFGDTFEVTGVRGRLHILLHKGNVDDDSRGCILVGEEFSTWTDGTASIARSGAGFDEFRKRVEGEDAFELEIVWT